MKALGQVPKRRVVTGSDKLDQIEGEAQRTSHLRRGHEGHSTQQEGLGRGGLREGHLGTDSAGPQEGEKRVSKPILCVGHEEPQGCSDATGISERGVSGCS